jgi:malonyl-CoA O-methyltransferase
MARRSLCKIQPAICGVIEHVSTRAGYDRWSSIYDGEDNPLVALETPVVEQLLGRVAGLSIADVGCGTGRHALVLAAGGAEVTALDFSEGMLARARQKVRAAGLQRITFLQHDLLQPLPLPDAGFDRVLCCLVLDHVPEPQRLFAELGRICKLDGAVIVSVMHPALMLKGIQARFVDPETGSEIRPESCPNQISDYVMGALRAGLRIESMSEHVVDAALAARCPRAHKYLGWPMLLAMKLKRE